MKVSVIICTHNPKENYLRRTLDALRNQSLPYEKWELLVIDNASNAPVDTNFDISWHPNGRILQERELGLTPARLRGIDESSGGILVFVDDDNLLAKDYLETGLRIGESHPFLGAWGGSCLAEYEEEPPEWFKPYEGHIAVRKVDKASWSNRYFDYESTPVGAGMCIRGEVARHYRDRIRNASNAVRLDRKGSTLMSCGDHDMAWTSMEVGLGIGVFPELSLVHIIPEGRTREDYVIKLLEGSACSSAVLRYQITGSVDWPPAPRAYPRLRAFVRSGINLFVPPKRDMHALIRAARLRGMGMAKEMLCRNTSGKDL